MINSKSSWNYNFDNAHEILALSNDNCVNVQYEGSINEDGSVVSFIGHTFGSPALYSLCYCRGEFCDTVRSNIGQLLVTGTSDYELWHL